MSAKAIPEGYHSVTAYLSIDGAAKAIEFYKQALNATERLRLESPDGNIGHAEITIGDSTIMLADGCDETPFRNPQALGGSSVGLHLYVANVDALYDQAIAAGATAISPVQDQFYGDRSGSLQDPYGHIWFIATHMEDLSQEEINQRAQALFAQ